MPVKTFIFDLDGVIVDTAKFHFLAWKNLADGLGIPFSHELNEQLKGVSRVDSLNKILSWGNKTISNELFNKLMVEKNEEYLTYIEKMDQSEILPDVNRVLDFLIEKKQAIALGSASKNARQILEQLNLIAKFNTIVDGTNVTQAKPNPEVFLKAATQLSANPKDCVVFEDAVAGIEAANRAGMLSIGIGDKAILQHADIVFKDFTELSNTFLNHLITGNITKLTLSKEKN